MTARRPHPARLTTLNLTHLSRLLLLALPTTTLATANPDLPFVINTWAGPFTAATDAAYHSLTNPSSPHSLTPALDAVEIGCATCEQNQCDTTVGFGGSPDEACETTLDALIMDGTTLNSGAVAGLRRIRDAVSVARAVLEHTRHSLLVGDLATRFAVQMGFGPEGDLGTVESRERCEAWRMGGCKGNYWVGVEPDPERGCGPYRPVGVPGGGLAGRDEGQMSHDTISMVVIDGDGVMAAGTSTNGAAFKIPGRVGDGPIVGSGSYVDGDVGGCGATGDGDIMMRFLPCYQAVENLRLGMTPTEAAEDAMRRMLRKYPKISSGVVVVNNKGEHGAAGSGWTFTYAFRGGTMNATEVVSIPPLTVVPAGGREAYDGPGEI
ncbi:putative isoaspartyl peptidase/L-asparaginase 3 [Parachaetomium inaequale]|uniref:Isoaspartyl peptidase/L-asparaginase 3 n=1 Tax=Parachaetomium inaequale TaxID=2588326 RepID=A0AAN6SPJ5_9PEZI|nr:putative isoaspartyl peptidase/L-asparaginase 3 [Parachaetomium inaequale]